MKKLILAVSLATLFSFQAYAQDKAAVHTSVPDSARYEIIQSEVDQKWVFRLDKYTGKVWLMSASASAIKWTEMKIIDLPSSPTASSAIYQIFISGRAGMFLLNTDTGKTWFLDIQKGIWVPSL